MTEKPQQDQVSVSREECEAWIADIEGGKVAPTPQCIEYLLMRLARTHLALLDASEQQIAGNENWWAQNSVQCQNCSVQLVARGGPLIQHGKVMLPTNFGLTHEEGEEEALCGYCAGEELHRLKKGKTQAPGGEQI